MTNWTIARQMTDEERAKELPCFVHHADAGGQCRELAKKVVYGLNFCEAHGAEVGKGTILGAYIEASDFVERLLNPYVPALPDPIGSDLEALAKRYAGDAYDDRDYHEAIKWAYLEVPERVRDTVDRLAADESEGPDTAETLLLDSLRTLHDCQRVAYGRGETWLVEQIEMMRQAEAARCSYALRELSPQS